MHPFVQPLPHMGEERCLVGRNGSGTIFFGRCNLHCVFCQNWDISQEDSGTPCDADRLADIMLALQEQRLPQHQLRHAGARRAAGHRSAGRWRSPAACGCRSSTTPARYDSMESLRLLDGLVDIYMPDFKFWSPDLCAEYLEREDYAERARRRSPRCIGRSAI